MLAQSWTEWATSGTWLTSDQRSLPLQPGPLGEALSIVLDAEVESRRLMRLVSREQVLAARILRLANVAASAPMTEVVTIEQAVIRLGTQAVRRAVLSVCFASWAQPSAAPGPSARGNVEHSIQTACLSRVVAQYTGVNQEEAFAQGLLHDIGKLFLLKLQTEFIKRGGKPPADEEVEQVIVHHHAEVGGMAMQLWGLPAVLREPIRWHHMPLSAPTHPRAAAVIYLANRLSHRYGAPPTDSEDLSSDAVYSALGLRQEWLANLDRQAPLILEEADKLVVH